MQVANSCTIKGNPIHPKYRFPTAFNILIVFWDLTALFKPFKLRKSEICSKRVSPSDILKHDFQGASRIWIFWYFWYLISVWMSSSIWSIVKCLHAVGQQVYLPTKRRKAGPQWLGGANDHTIISRKVAKSQRLSRFWWQNVLRRSECGKSTFGEGTAAPSTRVGLHKWGSGGGEP